MYTTYIYAAIAMTAFAANSLLCRWALTEFNTDPASFTSMRLISGAILLALLVLPKKNIRQLFSFGSTTGTLSLFIYATTFSFAYTLLDTGTGALILFGFVQLTMITQSILKHERQSIFNWIGIILSITGLVIFTLPALSTPTFSGSILMALSGIAWGLYSIKGSHSDYVLYDTASNFLKATPLSIILFITAQTFDSTTITSFGIMIAIISGAITSALGYALWYRVLKSLLTFQSAVIQLSVPIIAALMGIIILSEKITITFLLSSLLILSGILITTTSKYHNN